MFFFCGGGWRGVALRCAAQKLKARREGCSTNKWPGWLFQTHVHSLNRWEEVSAFKVLEALAKPQLLPGGLTPRQQMSLTYMHTEVGYIVDHVELTFDDRVFKTAGSLEARMGGYGGGGETAGVMPFEVCLLCYLTLQPLCFLRR